MSEPQKYRVLSSGCGPFRKDELITEKQIEASGYKLPFWLKIKAVKKEPAAGEVDDSPEVSAGKESKPKGDGGKANAKAAAGDPPAGDPPAGDPPASDPPAGDPPAGDPPKDVDAAAVLKGSADATLQEIEAIDDPAQLKALLDAESKGKKRGKVIETLTAKIGK